MAEFDIGTQCHLSTCKQLDFLPFTCDGCSLVFCLRHREKSSHNCSSLKRSTEDVSTIKTLICTYSCSVVDCNTTEVVPITCSLCGNQLCLKHRLPEDHNCVKLPIKAKSTTATKHLTSPFEIRSQKKLKTLKSQKMAAKVALMKLKLHSKGDNGIPTSERLYFSVHPVILNSTPLPIFVSSKWTVGKAIDFMANKLKLHNENNKISNSKLKLCSASTGEVISPDLHLHTVMENDLLFDGSSIVIAPLNEDDQNLNP